MPNRKSKVMHQQPSDDELLDAAIAENARAAAEAAAVNGKAAAPSPMDAGKGESTLEVPSTPSAKSAAPEKAALTKHQIIEKLNAIPTFCILNGDSNIVATEEPQGAGEVCTWFTDPDDARSMLTSAKEQNVDVAAGLHLGVTPLGLAFALAMGWAESLFVGEMRLQGKYDVVTHMTDALCDQMSSQGMPSCGWVLPTFCCDELQSPTMSPIFLSRADLVAAWVASGRSRESVPENLAVIELHVLVAQMQTDAFAWSTVHFVGSARAAAFVRECKVAAAVLARRKELAAATVSSAPPLLAEQESEISGMQQCANDDCEPPPLV